MANYDATKLIVQMKSLSRTESLPLDASSVWDDKTSADSYAKQANAYAGQIITAKVDNEYKAYILQGEAGNYTLSPLTADASSVETKEYVIVGTRPGSGQQQGVIYIDNNVGYIWNGSEWKKVFEDVSASITDFEDRIGQLETDITTKANIANPNFTGTVKVEGKELATKEYADSIVAAAKSDVPIMIDKEHPFPSTSYKAGQKYVVAKAGEYFGQTCEIGDVILIVKDYAADGAGNSDAVILQSNIDGAVTGPDSAVDGEIVVFSGATGKVIKSSKINMTSLNDAISKAHTHANKTQLDTYDKTQTELLDAAAHDVVKSNQGSSNSGKFLGIGPDGNVSPMDPPQGMTEEQEDQLEETNSELVDVRVGADGKTYTSAGDAVREQNSAISADIFSIMEREKNLVSRRIEKAHWTNDGVLVTGVMDYNAYVVDVVPGMTISFNTEFAWNANFNLMVNSDNIIIGKFDETQKKTENGIPYSSIPENVRKLHITIPVIEDSKGFVALNGIRDLTGITMEDYPIGIPVNPVLKENIKIKNFGSIIEKIESKISPNIYKNLVINKEEGYFWASVDNIAADDNYVAIKVDVSGGGVFSFNNEFFWNDHFCFLKTKNGESFVFNDSYKKQEGDILYTELNADAEYLYLTANLSDWDTVVLPEKVDLTDITENIFPLSEEKGLRYTKPLYGHFFDVKGEEITPPKVKTFYCGPGEEYTRLKDVIEEATKFMDSIVYVDAETFDLVEEFGEEYLDSYSGTELIGIYLKNRVHVIFANGSKVLFNYKGSNTKVHELFSPFNSGEYGFTLENAWIESTNCRYSVHDERGIAADPYHNKYIRCTMIHDSSNCSWGAHQAIGGGLGQYGDVLIEDGYYKAVGYVDNISYHNTIFAAEDSEAKSKVVIRGAYIDGTTLCANYGTSKEISQMFVCGCSLRAEPKLERVITEERADNMEVISWGNTIRTN